MPPRPARGRFLTFEGIDGCGKTTQLKQLAEHLKRLRLPFVVTREPGGAETSARIREVLLSRESTGMEAAAELLLYFAARAENVARVIRPALAQGRFVLCDRFTDATIAYQGYGRGLDRRFIRRLHQFACQGLNPDLTFVIDIDPHTSVRRALQRNTEASRDESRFEQESLEFYQRVRRGYHALARQEPRRVRMIPGEDTIENVHQKILFQARRLIAAAHRRGKR